MKQRKIDLNNIFILIYGFQFTTSHKTKVEHYRKDGSKVKFLTRENGEFIDCATGEEIEMTMLNHTFPLRLRRDVSLSQEALGKLYTPEEMKEPYVYSKGVVFGIDFEFEKAGVSNDKRCDQYKIFISDVLPLGHGTHKLELSRFGFATYLKYMDEDQIPANKFEGFENKCNKLIKVTHEFQARARENEGKFLRKQLKRLNNINTTRDENSVKKNNPDSSSPSESKNNNHKNIKSDIQIEGQEKTGGR